MNRHHIWLTQLCSTAILIAGCMLSCDTARDIESPDKSHFIKYYGGDGNQSGVDLIVNNDGSLLLLGNWTNGVGSNHIYLVKADQQGNMLWEKKLGSSSDNAKDIEQTTDGNFIILSDYASSASNVDIKLIKISPEGIKLDSVVYGTPGNENAASVTPLLDGGFIVTGATEYDSTFLLNPSNPNDISDIFHFRCNAALDFSKANWYEQYGPGTFDAGTKVVQQSSNLFYVFGCSNQPHSRNKNGELNLIYYSLNNAGVNGAINYLGDFDTDTRSASVMTIPSALGGGFLVTGTKTTTGSMSIQASRLRAPLSFNAIDDEQFDREISIESRKLSAVSASTSSSIPQGYLLLANELKDPGTSNIWLTKVDVNGNVVWSSTFGSEEGNDLGAAVTEMQDGGILILGTAELVNNQSKMLLLKTNSNGKLLN